jgi:hypothetical protein
MAFPIALGIGAGAALAGSILRGAPAKPRDFGTFMDEFKSRYGPARYGIPEEQYRQAIQQGHSAITRERDIGTIQGLSAMRSAGLGRSAAAGTLSLRSASAAEQSYAKLIGQLSALNATMAEQQRQNVNSQGIMAFEAQGREDTRAAAENRMSDSQFGQWVQMFVDPIENYYLMRDLKSIRALSYQPSAFMGQPTTEELFNTMDQSGAFDLNMRQGWSQRGGWS